ncbi:MAG: N-acetylmuramoyl-L-alanine amidase [Nodosilinea sp.]
MQIKRLVTGVIGIVGIGLLGSLPAKATSRLQTWQFDAHHNRLRFTTESGVQPRVSLLANPQRLVIDLPGIVTDEAVADSFLGGAVKAVKVMQVDARTSRMVLELDPTFAFDPHQVKVWGLTDQEWVVQLPNPIPVSSSGSSRSKAVGPATQGHAPNPLSPRLNRNQVSYVSVPATATVINAVQTTAEGFWLSTLGATPQVHIYRTRDANYSRQLVIDVLDAAITPELGSAVLPDRRYGVDRWTLTQFATSPPAVRITLNLNQVSPDWQVSLDPGGIRLVPIGLAASQVPHPPMTVLLPVIQPAKMSPPVNTRVNPTPPSGRSRLSRDSIVVMLDPGHGGADPGAVGIEGLQEKGVVLSVAQQVAAILRQQGITVEMTRQQDQTVDLQPRVDQAEAARASLFVSIHANAVNMQRPEVNGVETYYFSDASLPLANLLHRRVMGSLRMNDRGVRQARFFVLRRTSMPSALIEIGFVTGATDAPQLRNLQWQAEMARAIAQGILDYLRNDDHPL